LREVTRRGGMAIVQDPAEAAFPSMPLHAMQFAGADHVVSLEKIPKLLVDLVAELAAQDETLPSGKADPMADDEDPHPDGEPSYFTCPDCGGTLWEHDEHGLLRFRCRVGHAYSTEGLLGGQLGALESALWAAVVALEERRDLAAKLGRRLEQRGSRSSSRRFLRESEDANRRAGAVREALLGLSAGLPDERDEEALGEAN
jgi:two-component system chemotaxis response regulator CheB